MDSATWRMHAWSQETEFLASLLELTDIWNRAHFSALGGKPKGRPLKINRPGEPRRRVINDPDEIRRFLGGGER